MSISALSANGYWDLNPPSSLQKIEQEFQQLGSDLQSGNLTAAQADFVTLQQDIQQPSSSSPQTSSNPIEQSFGQLSQDLKAGNLAAAQQDFQTLQQDFQNRGAQWSQSAQGTGDADGHHHRHFHNESSGSGESGKVGQLMSQLGQDLQSGDLTSAQQTFASLQSLFGQFGQGGEQQSPTSTPTSTSTSTSTPLDSTSSTISVNA